jgi:hypothetical protein
MCEFRYSLFPNCFFPDGFFPRMSRQSNIVCGLTGGMYEG